MLTSMYMPCCSKTCISGTLFGKYLKNSSPSLYHLTEYNVSPSRSYVHSSFVLLPSIVWLAIRTFNNFMLQTKEAETTITETMII